MGKKKIEKTVKELNKLTGLNFPYYVGCLFGGALIRNIADARHIDIKMHLFGERIPEPCVSKVDRLFQNRQVFLRAQLKKVSCSPYVDQIVPDLLHRCAVCCGTGKQLLPVELPDRPSVIVQESVHALTQVCIHFTCRLSSVLVTRKFPADFRRVFSVFFPKRAVKKGRTGKAVVKRDLRDRLIGVQQIAHSTPKAQLLDIFAERHAETSRKKSGKIALGEIQLIRDPVQAHESA